MSDIPIVQIELQKYIDWRFQQHEDFDWWNIRKIAITGLLPFVEVIKNSDQLFSHHIYGTGYIPCHLVTNMDEVLTNSNIHFDIEDDSPNEITGGIFNIEWVS